MAVIPIYDTVIIGGGPAGLSAALVLGRCMRHALICDDRRYKNTRSEALHCYIGHDRIRRRSCLSSPDELGLRTACPPCAVQSQHKEEGQLFAVEFETRKMVRNENHYGGDDFIDELPAISGDRRTVRRASTSAPTAMAGSRPNAPVAVYEETKSSSALDAASAMDRLTSCFAQDGTLLLI